MTVLAEVPTAIKLANVRRWAAHLAPAVPPYLAARLQALEAELTDAQAHRAALPLAERFPALARWSAEMRTHASSRTALERAAAREFQAMAAEEIGAFDIASSLMRLAEHDVLR